MSASITAPPFKYRAFISYSFLDCGPAHWLHHALESYRLPHDIARRITPPAQSVSRKLGRFFIAKYDLACGSLPEQIEAALHQSEHLIVVCSPNSCKSRHVAEEISEFRALGRGRILALIVDGEPHGGERECFPEALKFKSDAARAVPVLRLSESLGADLRPDKDGEHLAKLKLVAGLLGVELDELRKRDMQAERARRQRATGIAAAMSLLAGVAVWYWSQAAEQSKIAAQRLDQSIEIANGIANAVAQKTAKLQIPGTQALELQVELSGVLSKLAILTDSQELKLKIEAEDQLRLSMATKSIKSVGEWKQYSETAKARYAELVQLKPRSVEYRKGLGDSLVQLAFNRREAGLLQKAKQTLSEAMAVRSDLAREFADLGDPDKGAQARDFRRDLSMLHLEIGIIAKRQGSVTEALENFEAAGELRREIAWRFPHEPGAARDVTEAEVELADAKGLAGEHALQRERLEKAVATRRTLLAKTGEPVFKRYLAWGLVFLGEAALETGDVASALACLEEARDLQHEVYLTDPASARLQKDLAWAEGHLGDALLAADKRDAAAEHYGKAAAIAEKRHKEDEINDTKRRDWAYWLTKRGKAWRLIGHTDKAIADLDQAEKLLGGAVFLLAGGSDYIDGTNRQLRTEWAGANLELALAHRKAGNAEADSLHMAKARDELTEIVREAPRAERWRKIAAEAGLVLATPVIRSNSPGGPGDIKPVIDTPGAR